MSRHDFRDPTQRRQQRALLGGAIILVGFIALLDNLGFFPAQMIKPAWPLLITLAGALKLQQTRHSTGGYIVGTVLVVLGVAMTASNFGWMHFHVRDWWPAILIVVGLNFLLRPSRRQRQDSTETTGTPRSAEDASAAAHVCGGFDGGYSVRQEHEGRLDVSSVMSGFVLRNDSPAFEGGEVTALMGGVELDLRQASMTQPEAVLHVFALMGGISLKVPADWSVVVRGMPILGGIDDKSVPPMTATKRLIIDGYVIMGGVDIKN